ncbi:hypothetical protein Rsub_05173 [Raphidocelis subcapitata]|uniref:Uncharacterized protein n=1 Tax=Raphidocelis subcapitata TaxID=307507 RepID=A0A2V0NZ11_9CHLO|nr:hypothetical protein Rsub_05173 [Raphidocelis subcapitata]|eukprot:GBF92559.1 hypothetical protein Rsub_05173 [Raphidocelis subcapitata]
MHAEGATAVSSCACACAHVRCCGVTRARMEPMRQVSCLGGEGWRRARLGSSPGRGGRRDSSRAAPRRSPKERAADSHSSLGSCSIPQALYRITQAIPATRAPRMARSSASPARRVVFCALLLLAGRALAEANKRDLKSTWEISVTTNPDGSEAVEAKEVESDGDVIESLAGLAESLGGSYSDDAGALAPATYLDADSEDSDDEEQLEAAYAEDFASEFEAEVAAAAAENEIEAEVEAELEADLAAIDGAIEAMGAPDDDLFEDALEGGESDAAADPEDGGDWQIGDAAAWSDDSEELPPRAEAEAFGEAEAHAQAAADELAAAGAAALAAAGAAVDAALAEPRGWLSSALDAVARTADQVFEAIQAQQVQQQQAAAAFDAASAMPRRPCPRMAAIAEAAAAAARERSAALEAEAAAEAEAFAGGDDPIIVASDGELAVVSVPAAERDAQYVYTADSEEEDADWDGVAAAFDEQPADEDWTDCLLALALAGACAGVLLGVARSVAQLRAAAARGYSLAASSEAEATARKLGGGASDDVLIIDEADLEAADVKGAAPRVLVVVSRPAKP